MSNLAKQYKNPKKIAAIELFGLNPNITVAEVASAIKVPKNTVSYWRQDTNFLEACYDRYMLEFGSQLPSVLSAMIREAQAGNVQAGRLVLEHSGKLVKNINVTIDSPFEKFLKSVPDAEVVDDAEIIEAADSVDFSDIDLPERKVENQVKRIKEENISNTKAIEAEKKRLEYNQKQKEWYKWRKRAEAAGVKPLKSRRPTPAQRQEWQNKIIKAEELNESK